MKKLFLFLMLTAVLFSCNKKPAEYFINGKINNPELNGKFAYLQEYGHYTLTDKKITDSVLIENNAFSFTGRKDTAALYTISFDYQITSNYATFILDNSVIDITFGGDSTIIKGNAESDIIQEYRKWSTIENRKMRELWGKINNAENDEQKQKMTAENDSIFELFMDKSKELIRNNSNNLAGAFVYLDIFYAFSEDDKIDLFDNAGPVFKSVIGMNNIEKRLTALKKIRIGNKFIDFEMADAKGKIHKLSDYAGTGKVVLVDFWASWCKPCIVEIPNVKALYKKYKGKGFEIVGISLDNNEKDWITAMDKHMLEWPNLSDLKGWESEAAKIYSIDMIPQTLLIGKDGAIAAKNMESKELEKKVEELLQNN